MKPMHLVIALFIFISCSKQKLTTIVTGEDDRISMIGNELADYLRKTWPDEQFELSDQRPEKGRMVVLELAPEVFPENGEAFEVRGLGNELTIKGATYRALSYGVTGFLKDLGWRFYLSFELPPADPKPLRFSEVEIINTPLKDRRILFNWHNFLSGCTGWDLEQWQQWINMGVKTGYNMIMVHAYGNNPMHAFSFNGQTKQPGYLTTTLKGRDWGTQHVNDVRLLAGGELFSDAEFGSKAAKVPEEDRVNAATDLMQKVFRFAGKKEMDVCFALDVDTWMSNPQNIINTLPREALITIGGYNTVNPDHPEGKKYYRAQLEKLFSDYPEIDMLAAWMRQPVKNPGLGSIWLLHESSTLPETWKKEYFEILRKHPEIKDERPYPGIFAISKIVKTFREILDEIKPGTELALGSWRLYYPKQADPFMPEYCSFIPLDWEVVFDRDTVIQELTEVGKNRKLYPVVWAHHDDHRYVGRPYIPFAKFNDLLDRSNAPGYGVIHWTTHPLDLLFTNYENQVWANSVNEPWETTIRNYSIALQLENDPRLTEYFMKWYTEAPMFGRETSDHFLVLNQDYYLEGYSSSLEAIQKAEERLTLLQQIDRDALTVQGKREVEYQEGMEKFILSFFNDHHFGHLAFQALKEGKPKDAVAYVEKIRPEETIKIFAETIGNYGATKGELGLLVSLQLRWLPDYIDLRQRTGLEPVRINFQPVSHDSLAQGAGRYTFFIDEGKNLWLGLGEKELHIPVFLAGAGLGNKITESWLETGEPVVIPVRTMRNYPLPEGDYSIRLTMVPNSGKAVFQVLENDRLITSFTSDGENSGAETTFHSGGGQISLRVIPEKDMVRLAALVVH